MSCVTSPSRSTAPSSASWNHDNKRIRVVFPDPVGPDLMPTVVFGSILRSIASRTNGRPGYPETKTLEPDVALDSLQGVLPPSTMPMGVSSRRKMRAVLAMKRWYRSKVSPSRIKAREGVGSNTSTEPGANFEDSPGGACPKAILPPMNSVAPNPTRIAILANQWNEGCRQTNR